MKRREFIATIALACLFLCASIPAQAGDDLVQTVTDGCKKELDNLLQGCHPRAGARVGLPLRPQRQAVRPV